MISLQMIAMVCVSIIVAGVSGLLTGTENSTVFIGNQESESTTVAYTETPSDSSVDLQMGTSSSGTVDKNRKPEDAVNGDSTDDPAIITTDTSSDISDQPADPHRTHTLVTTPSAGGDQSAAISVENVQLDSVTVSGIVDHTVNGDNHLGDHSTQVTKAFPNISSPLADALANCNDVLCEISAESFVMNITACSENDGPVHLNRSTDASYTLTILPDINNKESGAECFSVIYAPDNHIVNVTVEQIISDTGNFTLTLNLYDDFMSPRLFSATELRTTFVTLTSYVKVSIVVRSDKPAEMPIITMRYSVGLKKLPVVMLSDAVGYVTSPHFDFHQEYPNNYDGSFDLHVKSNESVMIRFTHFILEEDSNCGSDYLLFTERGNNTESKLCGGNVIPVQIYSSSIKLVFHTDDLVQKAGFKMMYAILPKMQEPIKLSNGLHNCSVAHFTIFKPLFNCNMVIECAGGEDEENCTYYSESCGERGIEAGNKCYKMIQVSTNMTWNMANNLCIQKNQNLPKPATITELRQFKHILSFRQSQSLQIYIGAQLADRNQAVPTATLYKYVWQWLDGRTCWYMNITKYLFPTKCAIYNAFKEEILSVECYKKYEVDIICEYDKLTVNPSEQSLVNRISVLGLQSHTASFKVRVVKCLLGHMTRDFLKCQSQGFCGVDFSSAFCPLETHMVAMFVCRYNRHAVVHYTLVCDRIRHCDDNSDEDFCEYSPCSPYLANCHSGQCISEVQFCDGKIDCYDGSDEVCQEKESDRIWTNDLPIRAVVNMDGRGWYNFLNASSCSSRHFQCMYGYCIPSYLVCNGIEDCPGREDEANCAVFSCPGFYRCGGSHVCIPPELVCDGVFHCPQFDDELLCNFTCPHTCQCQGLAFVCRTSFAAHLYPELRYLDGTNSDMTLANLTSNFYLIYLKLSECSIATLLTVSLPNLRHLDLSWNHLTHVNMQQFHLLKNLRVLVLSGNPISDVTDGDQSGFDSVTMKIESIDISFTDIVSYNSSSLASCSDLKMLNMSWSPLTKIENEGFQSTPNLETIDMRTSPLKYFPRDLFRWLDSLEVVYVDNYILCCSAMLPEGFELKNCHSEQALLASCEALLKSNAYRVFLWLFASLAIVGNVGSFVSRFYLSGEDKGFGSFSVFVTNLSIADFFMGVYLVIIGVSDLIYRGDYLWHMEEWKKSSVCSAAGFLSVLSSEVSAFMICIITLERFLVVRFPFSRVHFDRRSALIACGIIWGIGIVLAGVPLLPVTSNWEFYSQTSICIPLPFTNSSLFAGHSYSFSIMIILNFTLFLLIATGQGFILWSVQVNSMSSVKKNASRDVTIARRLLTIVVSDFLCWFPIGLLGMLAVTGTPVSDELNVAVAIFVLPFNSALNPFLYTFNVLMEKRRKAQEALLLKRLEDQVRTNRVQISSVSSISKEKAMGQIKKWFSEQLLTQQEIVLCVSPGTSGEES